MKWISVKNIIKYLEIKSLTKIEHIKPRHGNCCTCQTCGHCHDECVCENNATIDWINEVSIELPEQPKERL